MSEHLDTYEARRENSLTDTDILGKVKETLQQHKHHFEKMSITYTESSDFYIGKSDEALTLLCLISDLELSR